MSRFVFAYRQPIGHKPSPETAQAWWSWFEGMRDHVEQVGNPAVDRATIGDCSPERTELAGFSLIEADDLDGATTMAKGCPALSSGGGVEVGLLGEVPPRSPDGA